VRIALASDWFLPRHGGIELHLRDLARELTRAGHEVLVITSTPGEREIPATREDRGGDAAGSAVAVHRLAGGRIPVAGVIYDPRAFREIGLVLARHRIDLVHAHVSIVSPVAYGAARAAQRMRIPTVATFHSVIPGLRGTLKAFDLVTRFSRGPAVVTAVSSKVARAVAPLAGPLRTVQLLPNVVYAEWWKASPVADPGGALRLVSAMRLNGKKRPAALLEVVRAAQGALGNDARVRLSIAGDGPQRARLEKLIARWKLGGSVTLLGHLPREELRALYARSDLFVLPTRLEAFGLAALEARAAGLPVAAVAGTGVADFIRPGLEGWLAEDDAAMAEIVAGAARDRDQLQRIAEHNRREAPAHDWPHVLDEHLHVYAEARLRT
jgi:glycosyltransferase involved in cell wall biosynthesis